MKKSRLILFFLLTVLFPAAAQTTRLLSPESGLVSSQVYRVCQDGEGVIWLCTEGGLLRFDGMGFESFRHDRGNRYSIPTDSVQDLCEDRTGTKWVATASGLSIFDTDYNTFVPYDLQDGRLPSSTQFISRLLEVPDRVSGSHLFVCTSAYGIYVIDTGTRTLVNDAREKLLRNLPSEFIRTVFMDAQRQLWVAPEEDTGIIVLDVDTLEPVTRITWSPDLVPIAGQIRPTAFGEDPVSGNIFIGTASHGLLVYEASTRVIRRARSRTNVPSAVSALLYNPLDNGLGERTFLVGNEDGGLLVLHAVTEDISPAILPGVREDLSEKRCTFAMADSQGNLWVSLYQSGVLLVPHSMFGFGYLGFSSKGKPQENSACITSIFEEPGADRLWVATEGAGLFCQEGRKPARNYNRDNSNLTNNAIMTVTRDRRGTLWIGTFLDGLFYLEPGGGIQKFKGQPQIGSIRIRTLAYDALRDRLYVGTHGAGLAIVDPLRQTVVGQVASEDDMWVSCLFLDPRNRLWIGTYNGPECYDPDSGRKTSVRILPDGSPTRVFAIKGDTEGTMWFGTSDGLFCLGADGHSVRQFTEQDGLPNNVVRDILLTPGGDVWLSTTNGLACYSPEKDSFIRFHAPDGLQGDEFRPGAAFRSASGKLYFGGPGGITYFNPDLTDQGMYKVPQVRLSRLSILDEEIRYNPAAGADNLTDKHISKANRIDIPARTGLFSVEFSAPEYANPQRLVYSYRLDGFDPAWKTATAEYRIASYTNVPPGRYRLEVRSFFEGYPDNFTQRTVDIRVHAPWYRQNWAYVLYFCLASLIGVGLYRLYRRRQRQKREAEEAELKELRLGLFTNLTHEIRTPLNLVMGPLGAIRVAEQDPVRKDTFNLMYRNCLRINRIVNQLMDLRKIDAGQMKLYFRETDIVYFIKDILQSFDKLAESKRIGISLTSAHAEEPLWIDQGNFDKIVYNILSNAFKHTPEGGRIRVDISAPTPNAGELQADVREFVQLRIFNSGSRIEEAWISRVFDRFVQVNPRDANSGSGVGLNLTKMLVELHHGAISAENEEDGVVFRVLVPVGKDHLSKQELSYTSHHKDLYVKSPSAQFEHEDQTFTQEEAPADKAARARKSVVVVDDDDDTREYLRQLLRGRYNVTACADAESAWTVVSETLPDAVVSDLVLPGESGSDFCARIRANAATRHIPVLILTGENGVEEEQAASDSGADKFLSKPISVELLLSSIAQAISSREAVKEKFGVALDYDYTGIKMGSADDKLLHRIVDSIQAHLDDPEFGVASLCEDVGISRVHLNRKLKAFGKDSPGVLIKTFRMKQAAYLLANNKVNVSEVAYRVGFSSHSYFSNAFREYFGMSPREFVTRIQENPDDESLKLLFQ